MSSKLRMLYVHKALNEKSDENSPMSSTDILNYLKKYGIDCDKKSIYSDIEALQEFGYDIVKTNSPKRGFFIAQRDFELPEVRLLIDAVQSAKFISAKKTELLLNKLEKLISIGEIEEIKKQVYIDTSMKCKNETIFYSIDALSKAIIKKKKVELTYTKKEITKDGIVSSRDFIVSPYAMLWSNDHYYLVANKEKYNNTMNLRIDKISNVRITDDDARPFSEVSIYKEVFDTADYTSKSFNMFSGESQNITLACDVSLFDVISDKFGDKVKISAYDDGMLRLDFDANISEGLVTWLIGYADRIKVISPSKLVDMLNEKLKKIFNFQNQ